MLVRIFSLYIIFGGWLCSETVEVPSQAIAPAKTVKAEDSNDSEEDQEKERQVDPEKVLMDGGRFELTYAALWQAGLDGEKNVSGKNENIPMSVRRSADGEGSFLVSKLMLKKGEEADLYAVYWKMCHYLKEKGIEVSDEKSAEALPGMVDGKRALFATVPATVGVESGEQGLTLYFVLIDCGDRVLVLQANLAHPIAKELKESCLEIIHSFRELD